MELPFLSTSLSSSAGGFSAPEFLRGPTCGPTFAPEANDIFDASPGGPSDIGDAPPMLSNFAGNMPIGSFGDPNWLWNLIGQFLGPLSQMFLPGVAPLASDAPPKSGDVNSPLPYLTNNAYSPASPPKYEEPPVIAPGNNPPPTGKLVGPANGKYDVWIEKYAAQYGVDPDVIKAIMAKESQGNPQLESPAGAVGLMQVKPSTASEILGRPVTAEELKNNPDLNIQVGVMYFVRMQREKGNRDDALGAYNQGPNANWRNIPESIDYVNAINNALKSGKLPTWG